MKLIKLLNYMWWYLKNQKRWFIPIIHVMAVKSTLSLVLDLNVLNVQITTYVNHVNLRTSTITISHSKLVTLKNLKISKDPNQKRLDHFLNNNFIMSDHSLISLTTLCR